MSLVYIVSMSVLERFLLSIFYYIFYKSSGFNEEGRTRTAKRQQMKECGCLKCACTVSLHTFSVLCVFIVGEQLQTIRGQTRDYHHVHHWNASCFSLIYCLCVGKMYLCPVQHWRSAPGGETTFSQK